MPNATSFAVRLAWCSLPLDADADLLGALVASCGGRLLSVAWTPAAGRYALAVGLDNATLRLLAAVADGEAPCPN